MQNDDRAGGEDRCASGSSARSQVERPRRSRSRSAARSRAPLLAALLVAAGAVVSADRLVAALWGDAPPPGAVAALRAYVSRLRGALAPRQRLRLPAAGLRA